MTDLQVNILSPTKVVVKTKADEVLAPGKLGCLGILPGHTRFLSELGLGQLTIQSANGSQTYFVSGGYVDVDQNVVTVLADVIEGRADIDVGRAEKSRLRALSRLEKPTLELNLDRALASLARANQRIATAKKTV